MAADPEGVITPGRRAHSSAQGDAPDAVRRRYLTEGRDAQLLYYTDHLSKHPAFCDDGRRLTAERTSPAAIKDMLAIAEHRGWSKVQVRGSVEFRREVWLQARAQGLDVDGYRPTGRDRQELERRAMAPTRGSPAAEARSTPDHRRGVTGELIEAGVAPYKHRPDAEESAFIKLKLENGRRHTVWGVGLPAALKDAEAQVGDTITVRRTGVEHVTKTVREKDADTGEARLQRKTVPRNQWQVVAERFRETTPAQAARDPALRGAQSRMAAIETVVRNRAEPAAAERIIAAARLRIAEWLERGARFEPSPTRQPSRREDERMRQRSHGR